MVLPVLLLIWAFTDMAEKPFVQRHVFDNPSCIAYAPNVELVIEEQMLRMAMANGTGIKRIDADLTDVRRERLDADGNPATSELAALIGELVRDEQPTGQLLCSATLSYRQSVFEGETWEIRYSVTDAPDSGRGQWAVEVLSNEEAA